MYFHVKGKGNENVKALTKGRAVSYTESHSDKRVCAENVKLVAGVCVCVCVCVHASLRGNGIESKRARARKHT